MQRFLFIVLSIVFGLFVLFGQHAAAPLYAATAPKKIPLSIKTTTLPAWISGTRGTVALKAQGGIPPYTWTLKSRSSLPKGFTLSKAGSISGTMVLPSGVTKRISAPFTLIVKDKKANKKTVTLTLTVVSRRPTIAVVQTVSLTVDTAYPDIPIATANDGMLPYTFNRETASGSLPFGMQITWNNGTAYLSGTPSAKGTYPFRLCVVDGADGEACDRITVTVVEAEKVRIDVGISGTGGGRWESDNGTCVGSGCSQLEVRKGDTVTFTATPNSNATFDGWSGACSGTAECVVRAEADTSVAMIFTLRSQNNSASDNPASNTPQNKTQAASTNTPQPGSVTIGSATCTQLDRYGGNLEHIVVGASGAATGPVGMSFNVYTIIEETMDCGTWTRTPGSSGSGSRCKRAEGQPETTNWNWKSSIQGIFIGYWNKNTLTVESYNEKDMDHYYTQYEKPNPCP